MERTKGITQHKGVVNAILTSDWHLREDQPTCRLDNFWEAQWKKVKFVSDLQQKYHCEVLHAGDLFHHWKPSPMLLSHAFDRMPNKFHTLYGQHDLPQHNMELAYKSGIYNLNITSALNILPGAHWNEEPLGSSCPWLGDILVWHKFNYQGKEPWPGCPSPMAAKLLRQYPQYQLILTGDNHTPFVETFEGRLLVNPGSLTRQDADQINYKPRVYLWYAESNTVELVYLPINIEAVSREHIDKVKERDSRIEAFVSRLNTEDLTEINFEQNLKKFLLTNPVRDSVRNIIYDAIEK